MRRLLLTAGVLPLLACSVEELDLLQLHDPSITELSHQVTVRLHEGTVLLTVNRQLRNDGVSRGELLHTLELPEGAVATSLRVGADAALLDAEEAETRWAELAGAGDAAPTTAAILSWAAAGQLSLDLFGLAPGEVVAIEYELQLPPVYEAGGWQFEYALDDSPEWLLAVPELELSRTPGAQVEQLPGAIRVRLPRAPIDRVEAKWALHPLSPTRTVWRFELDAAPVLEPAAPRPNVVFVVDASHSQGAEGINAQLELLTPYLANAPDAQVEVVLYRRFAERLFGRFVPASEVQRLLAAVPSQRLAPGNGSNLELGAGLAAEALAGVPTGPGRIVLFTDEMLRDGFTNELAIAQLARAPRETVVHVVSRGPSGSHGLEESRDSDSTLTELAAAAGGVFLRISGTPDDPAQAARTLLGLVRPIRIDDLEIEARGLDGDRLDAPAELPEGSTLRFTAIGERPPAEVTVTGRIWAREYRKVVPIDPALARWLPGLAIGIPEVEDQLSEEEVRAAALAARAVSRATSYLSAPPQALPSTAGSLSGTLVGLGSSGGSWSCGRISTTGCRGFGRSTARPDPNELLRALLAPGVEECRREQGSAAGPTVALSIEATGDEIVAVEATAEPESLAGCLTELVWAARLPESFSGHRTYTLKLNVAAR